jgi:hypothetical protein
LKRKFTGTGIKPVLVLNGGCADDLQTLCLALSPEILLYLEFV